MLSSSNRQYLPGEFGQVFLTDYKVLQVGQGKQLVRALKILEMLTFLYVEDFDDDNYDVE